ncbi:MAG: EipB family protein [Hyphomicrobiales bacterium]
MIANSSPKTSAALSGVFATLVLAAGAMFVTPAALAAGPASSTTLVAHRAIYDLRLKSSTQKSGIAAAAGRLVFELQGDDCVGYSVNMRIVTRFTTNNGQASTIDSRTTSWEAGDGRVMRYGSKQFVNAQLVDEVEGKAERGATDKTGAARYTKPEAAKFELPARAVFPVEHTKHLMNAAHDGSVMDRTLVFDGSELNKLYTAVSFIGKAKKGDEIGIPEGVAGAEHLRALSAWPFTVSYFDQATQSAAGEQVPSHEISFVMFENGISTGLIMSYENFALNGTLSELTLFEPTECTQ